MRDYADPYRIPNEAPSKIASNEVLVNPNSDWRSPTSITICEGGQIMDDSLSCVDIPDEEKVPVYVPNSSSQSISITIPSSTILYISFWSKAIGQTEICAFGSSSTYTLATTSNNA